MVTIVERLYPVGVSGLTGWRMEQCHSLLLFPTALSCCVGCIRFLQHHRMFEKKQYVGNKRVGRQAFAEREVFLWWDV